LYNGQTSILFWHVMNCTTYGIIKLFMYVSLVLTISLHIKFRGITDISPLNPSNKPNVYKLKRTGLADSISFSPPQILPTISHNPASLES
jgi:hypothetical protein